MDSRAVTDFTTRAPEYLRAADHAIGTQVRDVLREPANGTAEERAWVAVDLLLAYVRSTVLLAAAAEEDELGPRT